MPEAELAFERMVLVLPIYLLWYGHRNTLVWRSVFPFATGLFEVKITIHTARDCTR
jgi:hypothetical protein